MVLGIAITASAKWEGGREGPPVGTPYVLVESNSASGFPSIKRTDSAVITAVFHRMKESAKSAVLFLIQSAT